MSRRSRVAVTQHGSVDIWRIDTVGVWTREEVMADVMVLLGSMSGGHVPHGSMVGIRCEHVALRGLIQQVMTATVYTGVSVWDSVSRQYVVTVAQPGQWEVGETYRITHQPGWDDPQHAVRIAERIIMRAGGQR
jgi:hypothetical protein